MRILAANETQITKLSNGYKSKYSTLKGKVQELDSLVARVNTLMGEFQKRIRVPEEQNCYGM